MNDLLIKLNSRSTYRLFSDPEFKQFSRPMTLEEFYEVEKYYASSELYPKGGYWCRIETLIYEQFGELVKVYIKFKKVRKY